MDFRVKEFGKNITVRLSKNSLRPGARLQKLVTVEARMRCGQLWSC